jgi:hypothetical protein
MWPGCRQAESPPNGKTLALLCLKFVKHPDTAEIRRKISKLLEKPGKNAAAPRFRGWL